MFLLFSLWVPCPFGCHFLEGRICLVGEGEGIEVLLFFTVYLLGTHGCLVVLVVTFWRVGEALYF